MGLKLIHVSKMGHWNISIHKHQDETIQEIIELLIPSNL